MEVPLSVVRAWRSSFQVVGQPFFLGVLLWAILWASCWCRIAQGVLSAVWIAICCTHLPDWPPRPEFVPSTGILGRYHMQIWLYFPRWFFLLCILFAFGEVHFSFQSPEQASRPQSVPSALPWHSALWGYSIRSACYGFLVSGLAWGNYVTSPFSEWIHSHPDFSKWQKAAWEGLKAFKSDACFLLILITSLASICTTLLTLV